MYQTLQYREDDAVATIQLNRPQKKNSLNAQMRTEMETLLHELARKVGIRAVIITGGDEIFCAGADIARSREPAALRRPTNMHGNFRSFSIMSNRSSTGDRSGLRLGVGRRLRIGLGR